MLRLTPPLRTFLAVTLLAGCIERREADNVYGISPRPCETAVPADQTFQIHGTYATPERLVSAPPTFAIESATAVIDVETTVGSRGEIRLTPLSPLPPEDFVLQLVDAGALADVVIPARMFPAAYSGVDATVVRSYRATDNNMFVSFSQALDAATIPSAVSVRRNGATLESAAQYLEAPGHVVHVQLFEEVSRVEIVLGPMIRTATGAVVFDVERTIPIDPFYTPPPADGCEYFD